MLSSIVNLKEDTIPQQGNLQIYLAFIFFMCKETKKFIFTL